MIFSKGLLRPARPALEALFRRAVPAREHRVIGSTLHAHRAGTAPLPRSVDLDKFAPFRADQTRTEACTWHALPLALASTCAAVGVPLLGGKIPSMRQGWAMSRAEERIAAHIDGKPLPKLQNVGIQLETAIAIASTTGVLPMLVPQTPTGELSDVWVGVDEDEPSLQAAEIAAATLIDGCYAINPQDDDADEVMMAALAAGLTLYDAAEVDDAFESLGPGDIAQAPIDAPDDGGHAMFRNGYDVQTDQSVLSWEVSSWGIGWGANGRARVGKSWRDKVWATFVICPPGYTGDRP